MPKYGAKIQVALFVIPTLAGLWGALALDLYGPFGLMIFTFGALGFGFILGAKIGLAERTGECISWGTAGMNSREKVFYFLGYGMIAFYLGFSLYLSLLPSAA